MNSMDALGVFLCIQAGVVGALWGWIAGGFLFSSSSQTKQLPPEPPELPRLMIVREYNYDTRAGADV